MGQGVKGNGPTAPSSFNTQLSSCLAKPSWHPSHPDPDSPLRSSWLHWTPRPKWVLREPRRIAGEGAGCVLSVNTSGHPVTPDSRILPSVHSTSSCTSQDTWKFWPITQSVKKDGQINLEVKFPAHKLKVSYICSKCITVQTVFIYLLVHLPASDCRLGPCFPASLAQPPGRTGRRRAGLNPSALPWGVAWPPTAQLCLWPATHPSLSVNSPRSVTTKQQKSPWPRLLR